jgi:23S rRNA (guanosine2251-2'-O)-methyltransferase
VYIPIGRKEPDWVRGHHPVQRVDAGTFVKLLPHGAVHQWIAMDIDTNSYHGDINDLKTTDINSCVLILDNITDPHNFGSIIRTAAVFGVSGIIISDKNSCKLTGTVVKAASGGVEHTTIYTVPNLSFAIKKLKNFGFWIVSFCENGTKHLNEIDTNGKVGLIFGAEGKGIRDLQIESSDFVVKIPTSPRFRTLNVSMAVSVACYEVFRQRNTV